MKKYFSLENFICGILVSLPILFNLYLLSPELSIKSDVNDNVFAYALAVRMEKAWHDGNCPLSLNCLPKLTDHWVSYWALGYPLPHYYQHLPSIVNVAIFKILAPLGIVPNTTTALDANLQTTDYQLPGLFIIFNWSKYILLCLYPFAIFWAARKFKFPKLAAGFSSLLSLLISTNFQYGTDYGSLLWRGSGMYTQLWGMFFLPLAVASIYDSLTKSSLVNSKSQALNPKQILNSNNQNSKHFEKLGFRIFLDIGYWNLRFLQIPHLFRSVLLLALTFHSHVFFGYIAVLSCCFIIVSLFIKNLIVKEVMTKTNHEKINNDAYLKEIIGLALSKLKLLISPVISLTAIFSLSFLSISYWIIPLFKNDAYHAHSVWDELYKFNSFGFREVLNRYLSGEIFDTGRFPIFTILVFFGFFYALNIFFKKENNGIIKQWNNEAMKSSYLLFPLLLLFWTFMYFGRTTWGSLMDILPGSEGIHMHRFINGIHFAGIFLGGLGLYFISLKSEIILSKALKILNYVKNISENYNQNASIDIKEGHTSGNKSRSFKSSLPIKSRSNNNIVLRFACCILFSLLILSPAIKERYNFLKENTKILNNFNEQYLKDWPDFKKTLEELNKLQNNNRENARIWAGRPGNWGRQFKVGGSEVYLVLSVLGYDTLGFEPESWSPNTDLEQFFSDIRWDHYNLFNIRYVIAPPDQKFPEFVKKVKSYGKYNLYTVETDGNFDFIDSDVLIFGTKFNTINFNRFWLDSRWPEQGKHPTLTYIKPYQNTNYPVNIKITDWANFKLIPETSQIPLSLLANNPFYATPSAKINTGKVVSEEVRNDFFSAKIQNDKDDLLMLKATFHPFWIATIDGKTIDKQMVAPYFMAVKTPSGEHEVAFTYEEAFYKKSLLIFSLISLGFAFVWGRKMKNQI